MILHDNLSISPFDTQRWVINTGIGHNLLVNDATARLFGTLQAAGTLEQARARFNQEFRSDLSTEAFDELLRGRFGGYGILAQDQGAVKAVAGAGYIKLKVELLSANAAAACAAPLRPFYTPRFFWLAFGALLFFLLAVYLRFGAAAQPTGAVYWTALPLIYGSIFVHEFGHIAACGRFGVRHGGIGFGFYLFIFPVLYADVTNIWQASRQRRIITNLGGIFSQLLYAALLAGIYLGTGYSPLLLAAMSTAVLALWQFNPFIRRDGYWLLSDLTNTPNLLQKAALVTKSGLSWQGLRRVVHSRGRVLRSKRIFLLLYGLVNAALLLVFAGYVITRYHEQLLHFPQLLLTLLHKLADGTLAFADVRQVPLLVFTFYLLLLRYGFTLLSRWRGNAPASPQAVAV